MFKSGQICRPTTVPKFFGGRFFVDHRRIGMPGSQTGVVPNDPPERDTFFFKMQI
jgi:hypothetical protein